MLLRVLQRLARIAPRPARFAWSVLPEKARRRLGPFVYPVALGHRGGSLTLPVPTGAIRALDLITRRPVLDALPLAVRREIEAGLVFGRRPAGGLTGGGRIIALAPGEDPREPARRLGILDAVALCGAEDAPLFRSAGFRPWSIDVRGLPSGPADLLAAFPTVSIVVVTFNNRDLCRSCLLGIERNTPWPKLEVVVVDNGSADGTRAMVASLAESTKELRLIANTENRGYAAAANQGIRAANGELIVLLNDDTVVAPGWLSRLSAHLESNEALALVGPVTNEIGNCARVEVDYATLEGMEAFAVKRAFEHRGELRRTESLALFCALARRSTLEAVGLLDERYQVGLFEDDDLSLSLRTRGLELGIALDAFVHHVGQASFGRLSDAEYLRIWRKNRREFERKWGRRWTPPQADA